MAAILGLLDTKDLESSRFNNHRRSVFYNFPAGAAPLTGLLSLLKEEETDDPKFYWYEKRLEELWSTMANIATTVVFYSSVTGLGGSETWTTAVADLDFASNTTVFGVKVADASKFRPGNTILIKALDTTGAEVEIHGVIATNGVDTTNNRIAFNVFYDPDFANDVDFNGANAGKEVLVIGSANYEGASDRSTGRYKVPISQTNFTQIHKTPFTISGTKLNTSVKYDETGAYKDLAKDNSVDHMIGLERSVMFGERAENNDSDEPITTSGGILFFLREWEAGSTYGNTSASSDSDDNKRIIENSSGVMTEKLFDKYVERVFRITNNKVNEKLVLCGSGFLSVINQLYRSKTQLQSNLPMSDTYGMDVTKHVSPFGGLYYRSHPLFSQHPSLRYSALIVDVHNLVYRYVIGRDTELLTNRQANDADNRKDEWVTECGYEVRYPESHMFLKNVTDFA